MKGSVNFPKPTPAEQDLHKLCDRFYETLERGGQRAAQALVKKALAAVEPPKETPSDECRSS
jgi:hypothetical protein